MVLVVKRKQGYLQRREKKWGQWDHVLIFKSLLPFLALAVKF